MSDEANKQGARKSALRILGALALLSLPFGWSVFSSYRAFKDYVRTTLDEPAEPQPWTGRAFDADECVTATLEWVDGCPGFEEFCRRAIPAAVASCLSSRDRRAWCAAEKATLTKTSYGYDACKEHVDSGRLENSRLYKQRCSIAYRAVADWCGTQHPPPQAQATEARP